MTSDVIGEQIKKSNLNIEQFIVYFREKCKYCGHQRIMHDKFGKCEGVMNKPCSSGCDIFKLE